MFLFRIKKKVTNAKSKASTSDGKDNEEEDPIGKSNENGILTTKSKKR